MSQAIHTKKFVRIWFSPNPNEFLGLENELSMIRLVEKNKGAAVHLMYSGQCLNRDGKSFGTLVKLARFCKVHGIKPIDIDTHDVLKDETIDPREKQMFVMAKEQVARKLANKGGSFAAASDYVRATVSVLKLGSYLDFDTEVDFSSLPELFPVRTPIIIPVTPVSGTYSFNNDFLSASVDPNNSNELSAEAVKRIRLFQERLIEKSKEFNKKSLDKSMSEIREPLQELIKNNFFKLDREKTIESYRLYLEQLDIRQYYTLTVEFLSPHMRLESPIGKSDKEVAQLLGAHIYKYQLEKHKPPRDKVDLEDIAQRVLDDQRNALLVESVALISGAAENIHYLFSDVKQEGKGFAAEINRNAQMFIKLLECDLKKNNLHKYVTIQDEKPQKITTFVEMFTGKIPHPNIGYANECSWTPIGAMKKAEREHSIRSSGIKFLYEFRKRKALGTLGKLREAYELDKKMGRLKITPEEKKQPPKAQTLEVASASVESKPGKAKKKHRKR